MTLSPGAASMPGGPTVAVAPEGRAVVTWWRRAGGSRDGAVQMSLRAAPGAPFIGPQDLSGGLPASVPTAAAAAAGAHVAAGWGDRRQVRVRVLRTAGVAGTTAVIREGAALLADVTVGTDGSGGVVAVWTRDPLPAGPAGGDVRVRMAVMVPGVGWSPAEDISGEGATRPALALAPDGNALIAWNRAGGIEVARRAPGAALAFPPALISTPDAGFARVPAVALGPDGEGLVAWYQNGVMAADIPAGRGNVPAVSLSAPAGLPTGLRPTDPPPRIALGAGGRAVVAWARAYAGTRRVEAAVRPAGGAWLPAAVLSGGGAGAPALGSDGAGGAVVAWTQETGAARSALRARALARSVTAFAQPELVVPASRRTSRPSMGLDAAGRAVLAWREEPVRGRPVVRAAVRLPAG